MKEKRFVMRAPCITGDTRPAGPLGGRSRDSYVADDWLAGAISCSWRQRFSGSRPGV